MNAHGVVLLQQAGFGERVRAALADDEVIQHPDIDGGQGTLQPLGDRTISGRGLGVPRGVLMRQDQRRSVERQRTLDHHPRIHAGLVDRALEQRFIGEHLVLVVEKHDGEDFVRILLGRPQCPLFISYKLYRHFVGDIDEKPTDTQEAVIRAMAKVLSDNRYELKPVLKTLFKSEHFYDPQIVGGLVKSPAQLLVGTARMLNTPARNSGTLAAAMSMMGQQLFEPPSVAGWDGGRGWINTSTLFVRQNLATYLITGKVPGDQNWSQDTVGYDPLFLLADLAERSPGSTVNLLSNLLLGEHAAAGRREELTKYLAARRGGITQGSVLAMLMLITAMPEYQLC